MSKNQWTEGHYIIQMECGHLRKYPIAHCPYVNEVMWCVQCRAERMVTESDKGPAQWSLSCEDCQYTRYFGQDKVVAQLRAIEHADTRSHNVDIVFGDTFTESYHPATESLFTTDEQQSDNASTTALDRRSA